MYGVPKGLGFAVATAPANCNWTDDFGECIVPTAGNTVVTPSGYRIPIGGTTTTKFSVTQWLNQNAMYVGIGLAGLLLFSVAGGRRR